MTGSAGREVVLLARSKLTLSLRVLGGRPDGYHDIDAHMVSVTEPHDRLTVRPAACTSLAVEGPFAAGVPADAANLAVRAASAAGASIAIRLHKGIPAGAGLGGGSTDAAAVLVAVGRPELAARIGSDVPFCVRGGAARVRGRGELIDDVEIEPAVPRGVVIAVPRVRCSTPEVYRAWDALGAPRGRTVEVEGLPPLRNDLEPAAEHVEPRLLAFRRAVEEIAGRPALLAGSGAAYAVVCTPDEVAGLRARLAGTLDGWVFAAVTADAGIVVEG